ncbi:MFS transporter [Streptomyces sp. NRRL S-337]|uniref:MFS transporter n=1 Tax=Streptomyces sp. NRRL S-337 TaxID=1463900 RepID=UPI00068B078B|nr:MFS transporter [Streptomyces sp. NRRL S-337]
MSTSTQLSPPAAPAAARSAPGTASGAAPARRTAAGLPSLHLAAAVGNADWHLTAPLLGVLATSLHTDLATVTAAIGVYSLGQGLALPLWGRLSDRFGPRRALRWGLAVAALSAAVAAVAGDPRLWVAARAACGAGFAAVAPCAGLYHDALGAFADRRRAYARMMTLTSAVAVGAPLLAGLAARFTSWRAVFAVVALLAAVLARHTRALPPTAAPSPVRTRGPRLRSLRLLRSRGLWVLAGLGVAEGLVLLGVPALLAPTLTAVGAGDRAGLLVTVVYGASVCAGSVAVRRLPGPGRPWVLLAAGGAAGLLATVLLAVRPAVPVVFAAAVLLGLAWGPLHTTLQTWAPRLLAPGARGTAASVLAMSGVLACAAGVALAAPLVERGALTVLFGALGGFATVLTALLAGAARHLTK